MTNNQSPLERLLNDFSVDIDVQATQGIVFDKRTGSWKHGEANTDSDVETLHVYCNGEPITENGETLYPVEEILTLVDPMDLDEFMNELVTAYTACDYNPDVLTEDLQKRYADINQA